MNAACNYSVLASSIVRPQCSGSSKTEVPNVRYICPTLWHSQGLAIFLVFLVALVAFPASVSASPVLREGALIGAHVLQARQDPNSQGSNNNNSAPSNGSISMSVWLPILLVTLVFALFSFCACVRRCAVPAATTAASGAGTTANGNAVGARPRRRPRRTPSQISTKSLPPYMKEPGDLELVLFRGPPEDDQAPPHGMSTLAEDDEEHEHSEMRVATFDIALNRIESQETMADASTTNLIRRPPELHHATMPHDHRRSGDGNSLGSIGSEAELLPAHQRGISVDSQADLRGEAPSYSEAIAAEGGMTTISLNDPEPNNVASNAITPPPNVADPAAGHTRSHSRFNFLAHNPFSSHHDTGGAASDANESASRPESPALHPRSGSALSRFSSRESHDSQHSRAPSRNNNHSHSRSTSNLFRAFRSHSPGLQAGSSTISLDSISAPLTHTAKRAEFRAPKGGLLTADQIKLITSREALGKFSVPYGPDAIAASRERLTEMAPPPDFESATGEHQEQPDAEGSDTSGTTEAAVQPSDTQEGPASPHSTSVSPTPQSSLSHRPDTRAESRASYATAPESDAQAQTVQVYPSEVEGETDGSDDNPHTARPFTPRTARPLSHSGGHGSVARRS